MGLEGNIDVELDKYSISEAVHELYEDLTTKVGKELHAVIIGKYLPAKRPPSPSKQKKGGKKPPSSSPSTVPSTPSATSPPPSTTQDWNMTPWRPPSPSKKKKKKKTTTKPLVRRPFGPAGAVFPATIEGDLLYIDALLSPFGSPTAVNWCDPNNNNICPLILAASLGKETMVASLLQHNAAVFSRTSKGNTALHEAAKGGYTPIVIILLRAGSEVDAENIYGNTPLSSAVRNGHRDVSEILVMVGANTDLKNKQNETPLDRTNEEDFKILLKLRRSRFLVASQKRIMTKTQELRTTLEQEKQQRIQMKKERREKKAKEAAEHGLSSDDSEDDEEQDDTSDQGDEDDEEQEEEIVMPEIKDVVPVTAITADFQLTLAKRSKASAKSKPGTPSCSTSGRSSKVK